MPDRAYVSRRIGGRTLFALFAPPFRHKYSLLVSFLQSEIDGDGMNLRLVVSLAVVVVGLVAPVAAQQPGAVASIRGRVIDPQGRGVQATIRVVQLGNGLT
jgi:hypothetical protein